jgi:magnesium-transporting ATPase (P-type)
MLLLWQAQVGDIIRLSSGDAIPADLLLLYTSDPSGVAFVDTSNLDGETNLKPRSIFYERETEGAPPPFDPKQFVNPVQCDQPNVKIYSFNGFVEHDHHRVVLSAENLLLRDCVLRNTDEVYGHPFCWFVLAVRPSRHGTSLTTAWTLSSLQVRRGCLRRARDKGHAQQHWAETQSGLRSFICFLRGRVLIRCDGCRSHQCIAPRRAFLQHR